MNKLLISPSPHVHSGDSIEKNMYGVLIALIPAFICSVLFFGMGAIIVTLTSVVACLFFEYVIQKFLLKQQPTIFDGSALITLYRLPSFFQTGAFRADSSPFFTNTLLGMESSRNSNSNVTSELFTILFSPSKYT